MKNTVNKIYCQAKKNDNTMCNNEVLPSKLFCEMHKDRCKRCRSTDKINLPSVCSNCYEIVKYDLLLWKS
jgi:hypothetical protein